MSEFQPVTLISGASSGFGLLLAKRLKKSGHLVYGTSRNPLAYPDPGFPLLKMDVCSPSEINDVIQGIVNQHGRIDNLVNNAGLLVSGGISRIPLPSVERIVHTNLIGTILCTQVALSFMLQKRAGKIVNVSSIAGQIGVPYYSLYSASKFGIEGFSRALLSELDGSGVQIAVVVPEFFSTKIGEHQESYFDSSIDREMTFYDRFQSRIQRGGNPDSVARLMERILNSKRIRPRYYIGRLALAQALMGSVLPDRLVGFLVRKTFGI